MHADGGVFQRRDAQDVAVFALEGGAGDDDAGGGLREGGRVGGLLFLLQGFDGFVAQEDQPVPAVGVCEGFAAGHFGDVGGGVVLLDIVVLVFLDSCARVIVRCDRCVYWSLRLMGRRARLVRHRA